MSSRRKQSQPIFEIRFDIVEAVLRRRSRKACQVLCRGGVCPLVVKTRLERAGDRD